MTTTPSEIPSTSPTYASNQAASAPGSSRQAIILVLTAAIFLLAGLLIATLALGGSDDGINEDELQSAVQGAVGTEIAAFQPGDELQQMVDQAVGTQVAGLEPIPAGDGGVNQADLQVMIDQAVGTQVQALIPTNTPIPPTPTRIPNPVVDDDDPFLGPKDALVTIVEFSDFQCSYCGKFYDETLILIREAYPDQVKFVYRDFPIFGEDSARAAMAGECADEQGKFWEMHNYLFDTHKEAEPITMDQTTLVSIAGELGMDTDSFAECLSSERYMEEVLADYQTAQQYGFRGTPGFVINGVVYSMGAQPFEVFDRIIKSELDLAQAGG